MKKLSIILIILVSSFPALAQEVPQAEEIFKKKEDINKDLFVMDFHNDFWLEAPDDMDLRGYALGFNFAFMKEYNLWKDAPFHFAWGLGFSSHNVHHNGVFEYNSEEDFTEFYPLPENVDYDKNKLSVNYIEVPLELRLRSRKEPFFRLYAGFKGGVMVNVHSKRVEGDKKFKQTGLENISAFRYGPTIRLGIKKFGIYGFYSLSELFEPDKGVELIPVSIGFSLLIP